MSSARAEPGPGEDIVARIKARGGTATIYDIAELAGVSPSTVSRALGKPGRISAATAARVRAAADRLDFRVNPIARALQTGQTRTLGLVVADITNPMAFGIVRGAEQAAASRGYTLVIAESQESGRTEAEAIDRILPGVDGLILATTRLNETQIQSLAARKPLVAISRKVHGVTAILPDVCSGIDELMTHLDALQHNSIAYLAGPATSWIGARRWDFLLAAAEQYGIAITSIGPNPPTIQGGRTLLRRVLATHATAAVAFNDLMAIGLMQEAAAHHTRVPDQLSVAGFDDIFGSELIVPALTTVKTDLVTAGRRAVQALLDASETENPGSHREDVSAAPLPTHLVIRGSTGPAHTAPPTSR